jgi:hypothetical protein
MKTLFLVLAGLMLDEVGVERGRSLPVEHQKPYDVLDWKAPASLNAYLVQQVHGQYDQHRRELGAALPSEPALLAYRDSAQARSAACWARCRPARP